MGQLLQASIEKYEFGTLCSRDEEDNVMQKEEEKESDNLDDIDSNEKWGNDDDSGWENVEDIKEENKNICMELVEYAMKKYKSYRRIPDYVIQELNNKK
ncbi:2596_t:CDS:2 [Entrophospora sp. SA101]|nr:2596_t:CDS:2 [Entrophospora sp. SA101]